MKPPPHADLPRSRYLLSGADDLFLLAVLAPEEEELVAMEVGSPPLPKKSAPAGQLDQPPTRIGTKLSPEPPGSKPEPQDSKSEYFARLLIVSSSRVLGFCCEERMGSLADICLNESRRIFRSFCLINPLIIRRWSCCTLVSLVYIAFLSLAPAAFQRLPGLTCTPCPP